MLEIEFKQKKARMNRGACAQGLGSNILPSWGVIAEFE